MRTKKVLSRVKREIRLLEKRRETTPVMRTATLLSSL